MGGDAMGWEGNRRSSIVLAIRYRLGLTTYRLNASEGKMSAYAPLVYGIIMK